MPPEPEAKLTLAQVRAIALPSRIRIIRCLAMRRATVTEVSTRTSMAKSTALKHLRALERYGLIRRHDDERLWVYYDLSPAGKTVGHMDPIRVLIIACIALATVLLTGSCMALWKGARMRASQDPWGIPPIGGQPVTPIYEITATILGVLALVVLGAAASLWWRRRSRRADALEPSSDTGSSQ